MLEGQEVAGEHRRAVADALLGGGGGAGTGDPGQAAPMGNRRSCPYDRIGRLTRRHGLVESPVRGQLARRVRRRGPGKRTAREGDTAPRLDPTCMCWRRGGWWCGWSTPVTSSTCRAGPRPTSWMRCGCARWPSGRCCGPASCPRRRSAGCGTWPLPRRRGGRAHRGEAAGEKLLEDAQIKLSVVASDIFGASGRAMLAALVAGERDPKALAQLAWARLRAKLTVLEEAFTGFFTDHHGFLLARMLARVDALDADIAELDRKLEELIVPFAQAVERLDEITGVGRTAAQLILAEIGTDMARFPTAGHLASWAKFTPGVKQSAGKTKGKSSTGHGNRYLARVLGEAAVAAGRTDTFLGERYRRIARRRGAKRAIVAVGRSILIIIWHLLADPDARFHDLGAGLLPPPHNPRARKAQPYPQPGSARLQGHPETRRYPGTTDPARTRLR